MCVDVDGLVQSDVTIGPDFSFDGANPDLVGRDANGHGTHLAGIIVGSDDAWADNNKVRTPDRFLGIAPDAELVSVKAGASDGAVDVSQIIAAVNWVIRYNETNPTEPIRVINLSYGTDSVQDYTLDPLSYAVERAWHAGIVVVAAAGNDGWDSATLTNPAIDPFVIAVGAAQVVGDKVVEASYSSEGYDGSARRPGRSWPFDREPAQPRQLRGSAQLRRPCRQPASSAVLARPRPRRSSPAPSPSCSPSVPSSRPIRSRRCS